MGLKGLHAYLRQTRTTEGRHIPSYPKNWIRTVYIDFCCDFFWLLQEYAVGFLRVTSSRREAVQQQDHYTDIARLFVLRVTDDLTHELNAFANQSDATKSCLVLDGARLQAKNATHAARQAKKSMAFKKAQRLNED